MTGNFLGRLAVFCLVGLFSSSNLLAIFTECPEGMVWGGARCEWKNICSDGKPASSWSDCPSEMEKPPAPHPIPPPVLQSEYCESRVLVLEEVRLKQKEQSLLVAGGSVSELFVRYLAAAKDAGKDIRLDRLRVIFMSENSVKMVVGGTDVRMSLADMIGGFTYAQLWERRLKLEVAAALKLPTADVLARRYNSDLICGENELQ